MAENDRTTGLVGYSGMKIPVRAASTAALTLSGEQTVDGVALVTNDRVLVKNQASSVDNGIYVVDTGTWERAKDADGAYAFRNGSLVTVTSGSVSASTVYMASCTDPLSVGSGTITFALLTQFQSSLSLSGNLTVAGNTALTGNLTVGGNTTLGDTSGDTLTINAGTWSIGANYVATRGAGAIANAAVDLERHDSSWVSGGASSDARAVTYSCGLSGATGAFAFYVQTLYGTHGGTGTVGSAVGLFNGTFLTNTGNVTGAAAYEAFLSLTSSGSVTTAFGFDVLAPVLSSTGAITTNVGYHTANLGHATKVTNAYAFYAEEITASLGTVASFYGNVSSGTNKYNLYMDGTALNYIRGATGIGQGPVSTAQLGLPPGTTGVAPLRIAHGSAPTSPVNGDIWTTTAGLFVRVNGSTVGPLS